jgi:hypothetical protein
MNLRELHSFKLSDAVKFHPTLNQRLWHGIHLQPVVRKALLKIAQDFVEYLGIDDLDVKDITISGSNAAYSYTDHSDIDLHLVVDFSKLNPDSVYQELFTSKKMLYNDSHKITVHKIPVECYVQDSGEDAVTLGEFSVKHNKWIKRPTARRADINHTTTRLKYEKLQHIVDAALRSDDSAAVNRVLQKIKQYRQAGLDSGGEFSPENLAFKAVRSSGSIERLYKLRDRLRGRELSIESMYVGETRQQWLNLGFQLHSDVLWRRKMYESQGKYAISLEQLVVNKRKTETRPKKYRKCILAMITYLGDEIMIIWGTAKWIGQTPTHYMLEIPSGIHAYAKSNNMIVFSSYKNLDKFVVELHLKYDHPVSQEQLPVMETKNILSESRLLNKPTLTVAQIAAKHDVEPSKVEKQLSRGIKVEKEHTTSRKTAREIALDHLGEEPDYYEKLLKAHLEEDNGQNNEYLYHATYRPLLKSIEEHGLGGSGAVAKWEDSVRGVVYLASSPEVAESYAESSDLVPEKWLDEIVILRIPVSSLDESKLHIDRNVQDNSGDTLEYHGVIPYTNITLNEDEIPQHYQRIIQRYDRDDEDKKLKYSPAMLQRQEKLKELERIFGSDIDLAGRLLKHNMLKKRVPDTIKQKRKITQRDWDAGRKLLWDMTDDRGEIKPHEEPHDIQESATLSKRKKFPQLPTYEQLSEAKNNNWWKFRDDVSSYLAQYDMNSVESIIADQCINKIMNKSKLSEDEKNERSAFFTLLDGIKEIADDHDQIKNGDTVDIVRVSTIRQFKILKLEFLPQAMVESINDSEIIYRDNNNKLWAIDITPINDGTLARGVYVVSKEKIDRLHTDLLFLQKRIESEGWHVEVTNTLYESLEDRVAALQEASGYIPSQSERNDPRWKTALTVDVTPNSIKDNARKLGSRIARDGRPPLLRK